GSLQGGSISIGSGNNVFKADTQGIWAGNSSFGSAPFYVNMQGQLYATDVNITGTITGSTISGGFVIGAIINGGLITGTTIQTANSGVYPRVELNSSNNSLRYQRDNLSSITFGWNNFTDLGITFSSSMGEGYLQLLGDTISLTGQGGTKVGLYSTFGDIEIKPGGSGRVVVSNWSKIYSEGQVQTLQSILNTKPNKGLSTTVQVPNGPLLVFIEGVL